MISFCLLSISIVFVSLIRSGYSAEKPLIFNPQTLEIYDFGNGRMTYDDGPYVAACPAKNQYEINFNRQYSLNGNALFVRHRSARKDGMIHLLRCEDSAHSVELAAATYTNPETNQKYLKFGYEVYFVESDDQQYHINTRLSYSDFEKVSKSRMERFLVNFTNRSTVKKTPLIGLDGTKEVLEMGFVWISKVTSQFTQSEWRVNNLSYSLYKKVNWPARECFDFKLHEELYDKWPLDDYYSPKNQKKIFSSVQLQEDECEMENYCVKKYTLVPAYQLQPIYSTSVSCTNYTTVPVWSKTAAPLLDYLDKFLFAIAQVVDKKLTIYSEVHETLELPTPDNKNPGYKYMYLGNPKKKLLSIPRVILKLVVYRTFNCIADLTVCWFQAVIVIHNEPTVTRKLCQEDICQQLGWANIQYHDKEHPEKKSQHIYCCKMNEDLKEILMGSMGEIKTEDLDLRNFPRYNRNTYEHEYEDKLGLVTNKMDQLYGDGLTAPQNSGFPMPEFQTTDYVYL